MLAPAGGTGKGSDEIRHTWRVRRRHGWLDRGVSVSDDDERFVRCDQLSRCLRSDYNWQRPSSLCLSVCLTIKIIIDRQNITTQMARLWVQSADNNWWNICTTVMISEYSWPASVIMSSYVTFRLVITVGVNILFFYRVFVTSAHIGPMAYLQSLCCAWWFSFDRTRTNG